jgi:hypothetical protein
MSAFMARFLGLIFAVAALAGCAPANIQPSSGQYILKVENNPGDGRFDISLISKASRPICVSLESWPNASGEFTVENEGVAIRGGGKIFSAKSKLLSAYCPGGCGEHRIKPGGELHGIISYGTFGDVGSLAESEPMELIFKVFPYYCR